MNNLPVLSLQRSITMPGKLINAVWGHFNNGGRGRAGGRGDFLVVLR